MTGMGILSFVKKEERTTRLVNGGEMRADLEQNRNSRNGEKMVEVHTYVPMR